MEIVHNTHIRTNETFDIPLNDYKHLIVYFHWEGNNTGNIMEIDCENAASYIYSPSGDTNALTSATYISANDNNALSSYLTVSFENNNVHFVTNKKGQLADARYPVSLIIYGIK